MPLDAICISALSEELRETLVGGRIDKIQQPERDMLLLSLRTSGKNLRLLIAAGNGNARVHITETAFENPSEPPMFCMLLRKHLVGAHISDLRQPDAERMLILDLDCYDEMGFFSRKQLVVEMIGRSSNVILVDADGRIVDCMRRMDFAGDMMRRMQPGMIYRMPPTQNKVPFLGAEENQFRRMVQNADFSIPIDKWLLQQFSGLSPLLCRELAFRCGSSYETLPEQMEALAESVKAGEFRPTLLMQDGKPLDFSFLPIRQYGNAVDTVFFESFCELLEAFYSRRDQLEQQRRRGHELSRSIRTARDRVAKKLALQQEELRRTEKREEIRRRAELVTANLYRIKKGEKSIACEDYYEDGCPEITINLDPLKTPQQNAAALFKEYNKLKGAQEHLSILITQNEQQLDYLNSVLDELSRAESEKDLSDLRRELTETGFLRHQKGTKADKGRPQAPLRFVTDSGLEILVGRNNVQNDELTTKVARRTDYWLHTQNVHGSHTILRCNGAEPDALSLEQAACVAAWYSQGREGGKIPVDYTMVRYVRKPSGALPGKVIYTEYRSLLVQADEALIKRLKK